MNKFAVRNTDLSKFKQLPHVPCGEVWRMTEYSQVALLDTDMVFDVDSESLFLNWFSHVFPGRHVVKNRSVFFYCFFIFSLCFASRLVPNCPFAGPGKIFSECNAPLCAVRTIPSARRRSRNINSFRMFADVLLLANLQVMVTRAS